MRARTFQLYAFNVILVCEMCYTRKSFIWIEIRVAVRCSLFLFTLPQYKFGFSWICFCSQLFLYEWGQRFIDTVFFGVVIFRLFVFMLHTYTRHLKYKDSVFQCSDAESIHKHTLFWDVYLCLLFVSTWNRSRKRSEATKFGAFRIYLVFCWMVLEPSYTLLCKRIEYFVNVCEVMCLLSLNTFYFRSFLIIRLHRNTNWLRRGGAFLFHRVFYRLCVYVCVLSVTTAILWDEWRERKKGTKEDRQFEDLVHKTDLFGKSYLKTVWSQPHLYVLCVSKETE